ncbi:O-acyltransferase WSD1 [Striga asiatica]|uniref:O-acyltransferase WSD1 n=1 Tax=Striga asiatica TaxID=4170 RepID=A0A5A7R7R8_STRAF|nr:O-acyltransferase WSD1 [Striga asiatica]
MEVDEPVSPTGQYFTSSVISVAVIAVLESEKAIDDSHTISLLQNVFLPISSRFSSIMVDVSLQDHVRTPIFPAGQPPEFYDQCFSDYLSKISLEQLPQSRPLWEIHIFKYPTKTAAGNVVFKLHHALGDGYSLMGALLSCLQRADNPEIPLTFPSFNPTTVEARDKARDRAQQGCLGLSGMIDTVRDFGWSLMKSCMIEDDRSPIRSGDQGVEFRPITISTLLYIQSAKHEQRNAEATSLVLLNTRNIGGYKSVSEMVEPEADSPWGNQFAFLHVSVPKLSADNPNLDDPLSFVLRARKVIKQKRNSAAVVLTGKLLDTLRRWRGTELTAKYIHSTLKNTSMTISNIKGPIEKVSLSNHPVKGFYFMVVGVPQSLTITMVSYMGELRVAVGTENGLIDGPKFKSSIQKAFDLIFKAGVPTPSIKNA